MVHFSHMTEVESLILVQNPTSPNYEGVKHSSKVQNKGGQ